MTDFRDVIPDLEVPIRGFYFQAGECRYHFRTKGEKLIVRLVDHHISGTSAIHLTMPAGNQVEIFPEPHDAMIAERDADD